MLHFVYLTYAYHHSKNKCFCLQESRSSCQTSLLAITFSEWLGPVLKRHNSVQVHAGLTGICTCLRPSFFGASFLKAGSCCEVYILYKPRMEL